MVCIRCGAPCWFGAVRSVKKKIQPKYLKKKKKSKHIKQPILSHQTMQTFIKNKQTNKQTYSLYLFKTLTKYLKEIHNLSKKYSETKHS